MRCGKPPCVAAQADSIGRPAETVVLEELEAGGDIRYWRDSDDVHHVPKRKLDELILA